TRRSEMRFRRFWRIKSPQLFTASWRKVSGMVDKLTPERRSWNMSRIRGSDTEAERVVRSVLHRTGYRFRIHHRALPGKPDIVLAKYRLVIFVHGCFWHRHGCSFTYTPKSRLEFWQKKFEENCNRDSRNQSDLKELNWRVIVVWECEIRDLKTLQ